MKQNDNIYRDKEMKSGKNSNCTKYKKSKKLKHQKFIL
jgi:hypothetical protein